MPSLTAQPTLASRSSWVASRGTMKRYLQGWGYSLRRCLLCRLPNSTLRVHHLPLSQLLLPRCSAHSSRSGWSAGTARHGRSNSHVLLSPLASGDVNHFSPHKSVPLLFLTGVEPGLAFCRRCGPTMTAGSKRSTAGRAGAGEHVKDDHESSSRAREDSFWTYHVGREESLR
jgi:hypothetical protein